MKEANPQENKIESQKEKDKQPLTRLGAAKQVTVDAATMIAAYTLSATVVFVLFLLSLLSTNEEEKAGASLASVIMNLVMVLGVALLLAIAARVAHYEGKIKLLREAAPKKEIELENIHKIKEDSSPELEDDNFSDEMLEEGFLMLEENKSGEEILIESFHTRENDSVIVVSEIGNNNNKKDPFTEEEYRDLVTSIFRGGLYKIPPLATLMMAIFYYSEEILVVLNQNKEAAQYASEYLRVYALAVIGILLRVTQEQTLFGLGHGKFVMFVAPIDFFLCSLLAVWLGFGGLGMPRLGPTGVAIAYDIESYLTSFFYFLRLMLSKSLQEYTFFNFFKHVRGARDEFLETFKRGAGILFALFNQLALTIATTLCSGLLNNLDQATAWGAVLTLLSFFLIITTAYGQACAMKVDGNIGNYEVASRLGIWGWIASQLIVTPPLLAVTFFPQIVSTLLRLDEAASEIFKTLIPIISVGLFASNIFFNLIQQLRPLGRDWVSTLLPFLMTVFGVPAAWFLGVKTPSFLSAIAGDLGIGIAYTGVTIAAAGAAFWDWKTHIKPEQIQAKHEEKLKAENEAKLKASNEFNLPQQSSYCWPLNWCPNTFKPSSENQQLLPTNKTHASKQSSSWFLSWCCTLASLSSLPSFCYTFVFGKKQEEDHFDHTQGYGLN